MPLPASGTDTTMARPYATVAAVTGACTGPSADAFAWRAASACRMAGLVTPWPITTTCAGAGPPGKAR